jgi:hypothetical protein
MSKTPTSGKSETVIRTPGQRTGKAVKGGQQVTPFDKKDTLVPQIIQNILDGYGGGKAEYEQYTDEEIKARKKEEKVPHPVGGFF